ncbi:hypothetical protein [Brevibacillus panacihumi]|uniref:Uncharacterized protein n=1 Tax=Brevibacillus panacihumi TaxID=497735 RepID=A0A3M8CUU5_9BACL|nr:hypothetical protein [Brevibacillus panacihumi]RNB79289.1 hypothetical protein EDM58_09945 [Brevibacillus panacihumi]
MNVIGIIQTDLNEFSVLFDQQQGNQGQDQQQSNAHNGESQDSQENDSMFLSFLDEPMGGGNDKNSGSQQQQQGQQNNGPQEMTVRIKGIPEGQKANFLQMYQILQDAKDTDSLHQSLTIVQQGNQQGQQGQQGQGQKGQGKSQNQG